jgi:hypothetical protein
MAEERDIRGNVNTSKYIVIQQAKVSAIGAGLAEYDPTNPDHKLKYAQLVHVINGAEQVAGQAASGSILQLGGVVSTLLPDAAADGTAVRLITDQYGRLMLAGYNLAAQAQNVNIVNDVNILRFGPLTQFTNGGNGAVGPWINVNGFRNFSLAVVATGAANGIVSLQMSGDEVGAFPVSGGSITISAAGSYEISVANRPYPYIRAAVTTFAAGAFSAYLFGGN